MWYLVHMLIINYSDHVISYRGLATCMVAMLNMTMYHWVSVLLSLLSMNPHKLVPMVTHGYHFSVVMIIEG